LSSKKLIVNVVPLKIKRQAKRAIQAWAPLAFLLPLVTWSWVSR
jgi:hypothetical protein